MAKFIFKNESPIKASKIIKRRSNSIQFLNIIEYFIEEHFKGNGINFKI